MIDNKIIEKLQNSTDEIHRRLDIQCELIENILNKKLEYKYQPHSDREALCEREKKLVNAIKDTIDVLEQTKKSFKSKRLEQLRKKLTDVLIE